jgi:LacI family transcriptional regulator
MTTPGLPNGVGTAADSTGPVQARVQGARTRAGRNADERTYRQPAAMRVSSAVGVASGRNRLQQSSRKEPDGQTRRPCRHQAKRAHGRRAGVDGPRPMTPERRVTLRVVADTVGVSVATVSRALNADPQISTGTRERVVAVADELGYVPDAAARSLAIRRSRVMGLMVPDATDPVHGTLIAGFERAAGAAGYTVIVATSGGDAARERRALREFLAHRADGIALMGSVLDHDNDHAASRGHSSPVVLLNSERLDGDGAAPLPRGALRPDEPDGMRQIAEHLVEQGCRAFAYVTGDRPASGQLRAEALRAEVRRRVGRDLVASLTWDEDRRAEIARELVDAGADAVVGYDDRVAIGLLDGFRSIGVRVPEDVAVVGFDDIPFAQLVNPRLTTVRQAAGEMGALAVELLQDALLTGSLAPSRMLPVHRGVRETSVRPR